MFDLYSEKWMALFKTHQKWTVSLLLNNVNGALLKYIMFYAYFLYNVIRQNLLKWVGRLAKIRVKTLTKTIVSYNSFFFFFHIISQAVRFANQRETSFFYSSFCKIISIFWNGQTQDTASYVSGAITRHLSIYRGRNF